MRLNTLTPAPGSRRPRKRVGRGAGSGLGKTCGRGHKGQKSRSGGFHKVGFEGGQMPLQRRLPKVGFSARRAPCMVVRSGSLDQIEGGKITLQTLRDACLIPRRATRARIILNGEISRAVTVSGIAVTRGARAVIEKAGGSVED